MKRALILGVGGQDGSYLAELLLKNGYEVHGLHRRSSVDNLRRVEHIRDKLTLYKGDLCDPASVSRAIFTSLPDEVYNLADQDDANWSKYIPATSFDITAASVGRTLESLGSYAVLGHRVKFFQPLSCLMFGDAPPPQNESTPLKPMSPYACAKAAAWHLCQYYRREHGMHVSCGIMFNHDSPGRSADYVLQKICKASVMIARGEQDELVLGNLDQRIDIGFAGDYVEAMHAMLQLDEPDDFCVCTGSSKRIDEIAIESFVAAGLTVADWSSVVVNEGKPSSAERCGNYAKLNKATRWKPKTGFKALVRMVVNHYQETL